MPTLGSTRRRNRQAAIQEVIKSQSRLKVASGFAAFVVADARFAGACMGLALFPFLFLEIAESFAVQVSVC